MNKIHPFFIYIETDRPPHHCTADALRWRSRLAMNVGDGYKRTIRPTTALQMPKAGVPASPWMWAKARSKLGTLIRLCGDGVVSNKCSKNGVVGLYCMEITRIYPFFIYIETDRPTHHCTADALRWCSRLAMDVGEGQKRTRCIDSPVRRRGDVECGENGWGRLFVLHGNI
jgi:hypothetical protein